MRIIDKAAWQIDGGIDEQTVIQHFTNVFNWLQKNKMLSTGSMDCNPPATEEALRTTELEIGMTFPAQYKDFMLESNGAEGSIGENSYLAIW